MYVSHLTLADFRSWDKVDVAFEPGVSVFVGPNGQGKTNLLEGLGYLASLSSHRVASDLPLIRHGADVAVVQAAVNSAGRQLVLEIAIIAGRTNRAKINRVPLSRARDLLGGLRTVLFAPEDLSIVRGDPSERRRFLDELLVQRAPRIAGLRSDYERVLKQRTALLKTAGAARRGGSVEDLRTLDVWDAQLADYGAQLLAERVKLTDDLQPFLRAAYVRIAPQGDDGPPNEVAARYVSSVVAAADAAAGAEPHNLERHSVERHSVEVLADAMLGELSRVRRQEIERGVTLAGPHRDEWELHVNGLPLRGYASHGEGWTAALALRLASYDLLSADGAEPVLILDDVFAELDTGRRNQLAEIAAAAEQVLISSAVDSDIPSQLAGARYAVSSGSVTRVQ